MDRTNLRQVLSELNDEYESLSNQDVVAVDVESIMSSGVNSGGPNYERIKIGVARFGFGETTTISRYIANAYDENGKLVETIEGYFLEPKFDPDRCGISGSDTAIAGGTYHVIPALHHGRSGYFEVAGVSGRNAIHIHAGTSGEDTLGCLLPGDAYEYNSATNEYSIPAGGHTGSEMNKFRSFMNRNGSGYATISIRP
ncbi:MAG: hypothetical protein K2F82_09485 [Muribaculaceae bacterium]|nr:hypothetical protein [Muribaculaceae bacterium]